MYIAVTFKHTLPKRVIECDKVYTNQGVVCFIRDGSTGPFMSIAQDAIIIWEHVDSPKLDEEAAVLENPASGYHWVIVDEADLDVFERSGYAVLRSDPYFKVRIPLFLNETFKG
jgi:hypothetical protein